MSHSQVLEFILIEHEMMTQCCQWLSVIEVMIKMLDVSYIFCCVLLFVVVIWQVCKMLPSPWPNQAGEEKNHCEKENFEPHLQRNSQGKKEKHLEPYFCLFSCCFLLHCLFILRSLRLWWSCWKLKLSAYQCGTTTLLGEMLSWARWTWTCQNGTSATRRLMNMHWRPG